MAISLDIVTPGTIGSYTDLVEKVGLWLDRDDLADRIPDFIALTEARLNRLLRTLNMEVTDLWSVSGETYTLPSDFRMLREAHIEGSPDRPLRGMSPSAIPNMFNGAPGTPTAYAIRDRTLLLAPPPASPITISAIYIRRVPPLTSALPSNWLLEEHPDIYVWGTLFQAAIYIRDAEAIDATKAMLDEAIGELKTASNRDRWGGAPLVPNTISQVRGARC